MGGEWGRLSGAQTLRGAHECGLWFFSGVQTQGGAHEHVTVILFTGSLGQQLGGKQTGNLW